MKISPSQQKMSPLSPRLSIYRWRLTMLASIMHRASGILLFMTIPLAFWLLLTMSHNTTGYLYGMTWLHHPIGKALLWLTTITLFYHFINGLRFLCLDIGFGESREAMKLSAKLVLISSVLFAAILAVTL